MPISKLPSYQAMSTNAFVSGTFLLHLILSFSLTTPRNEDSTIQTYIVRVSRPMDYHTLLQTALPEVHYPPPRILHVYHTVFIGFSATMTTAQAMYLDSHPAVLGLIRSTGKLKFHTTHTPQFLGLVSEHEQSLTPRLLWNLSNYGADVIIGMVDTGIWPESRSFRDDGLSPFPNRWKGKCIQTFDFNKSACNRKIIGAKFFQEAPDPEDIPSPRDYDGHGTHTASTAAGSMVDGASYMGLGKGRASGMAPNARLSIYKVSGADIDILAAIDEAVKDEVDIISLSLSSFHPCEFDVDVVAIATFGAAANGIFVSAAAGNGGPDVSSIINFAPWMTTVGASTTDRALVAHLILADGQLISGQSFFCGDGLSEKHNYPLIDGIKAGYENSSNLRAAECEMNTLNPDYTRGKIVVCRYTTLTFTKQCASVKGAGGVGIVITDVPRNESHDTSYDFTIPGLALLDSSRSNIEIKDYLSSDPNPRATIKSCKSEYGVKPSPVIAQFSSCGPNPESVYSLKPDLVAPGYKIIAAWKSDVQFHILDGTSMAAPHISGIAALIKGIHPEWSPAAIRSALMTTASTVGNDGKPITNLNGKDADIWAMGAGHVDPEKALHPGLVYNQSVDDYLDFLCAIGYSSKRIEMVTHQKVMCSKKHATKPWNLNQPGIVAAFDPSNPGSDFNMVIKRKVTSVYKYPSKYKARLSPFRNATVSVKPKTLLFKGLGEIRTYEIRAKLTATRLAKHQGNFEFGELVWFDGKHEVHSPVAVGWWKDVKTACSLI